MARGQTLGELVRQLRVELGHPVSPAVGGETADHLKTALQKAQEELADEYDWPFLRTHRDKTISSGIRYYDFPTDLPAENITAVEYLWNGQYHPVSLGIDTSHYNQFNSDDDVRADPVLRWRMFQPEDEENNQFEVWPLPASNGTIRFHGTRSLNVLVANEDTADLDDMLIVRQAAVSLTSDEKKLKRFGVRLDRRLARVRAKWSSSPNQAPIIPGGGAARNRYQGATIAITYNPDA